MSGRQGTYKGAFLRLGATDDVATGYATPGVIENKGSGWEKERKEKSRGRNSVKQ
jgi:hypothetical protein